MKILCAAIVHYADGVVLVRDKGAKKWRLPQRELEETEDILLCTRRCVLGQTGYRAVAVRFFKIKTLARTNKHGALIKFIFGCEIGNEPLRMPAEVEVARFTPDDVIRLAAQDEFDDPMLMDLIHHYQETIVTPHHHPRVV